MGTRCAIRGLMLGVVAAWMALWVWSYAYAITGDVIHRQRWAVQVHRGTVYGMWEGYATRRWHVDVYEERIRGPRFLDEKGRHVAGFAWGWDWGAAPAWAFAGVPMWGGFLGLLAVGRWAWKQTRRGRGGRGFEVEQIGQNAGTVTHDE